MEGLIPAFGVNKAKGLLDLSNGGQFEIMIQTKNENKTVSLFNIKTENFQIIKLEIYCNYNTVSCIIMKDYLNKISVNVLGKNKGGQSDQPFNLYLQDGKLYLSAKTTTTIFWVRFQPLMNVDFGAIDFGEKSVSLSLPVATF